MVLSWMWAITLNQPNAALVAAGKREFIDMWWSRPDVIGQRIAIHVRNRPITKATADRLYPDVVHLLGSRWDEKLTGYGMVVCTVVVAGIHRVIARKWKCVELEGIGMISPRPFGNFRKGRRIWRLVDAEPVSPPLHAQGCQGLWWWEPGKIVSRNTYGLSKRGANGRFS